MRVQDCADPWDRKRQKKVRPSENICTSIDFICRPSKMRLGANMPTELGLRHRIKIEEFFATILTPQLINCSKVDNFSNKMSREIIHCHYRQLQPFVRPCYHFQLERTVLFSSRLSIIVEIA